MKVVLVFCEGRHDVTFAQRSLSAHSNCKLVEESIHKLPAPLGRGENGQSKTIKKGLIAGTFERSFPEDLPKDLPLRAAGHSPVPCFQAIVKNTATDTMFFMARTEGKDQNKPVLEFLNNLDLTIRSGGDIDVTQYAAAFLFDANGAGVMSRLDDFRRRYSQHFGDLSHLQHRQWLPTGTVPVVPVGCFVFHASAQEQTGTIEDHLAPMAERAWPDRYAAAQNLIDTRCNDNDQVSNSEAKRLKAIITATGQFGHPGAPLSTIIMESRNGIPEEQFKACAVSRELAHFLTQAPL